MTQVNFYILQTQAAAGMLPFACRLLEKAYKQGCKVWVQCENHEMAQQLDTLLWTFNDISFIPHALATETATADIPVLLAAEPMAPRHQEIYLNLTSDIMENAGQIQRIVEMVPQDEPWLSQSRRKFSRYRELGYVLQTYKV